MNTTVEPVAILYETVEKCRSVLQAIPAVEAICLVGSLARGNADANSDVDLCIFVCEGQQHYMMDHASETAQLVGPILIEGNLIDTTTYCALYEIEERIIKVDYDYYDIEKLPELIRTAASTRTYLYNNKLLYDRHGDVRSLLTISTSSPLIAEPSPLAASIAIAAWSAFRMARRGELLEAVDIINRIRDPILTRLLCDAYEIHFENYRNLERKLPSDVVKKFRQTFAGPDIKEILPALSELMNLLLVACEKSGSDVSSDIRRVFSRIDIEIARMQNAPIMSRNDGKD